MAIREDFAIFVLTHGRADNVLTDKALADGRYSGKVFYVIDNEDDQADLYRQRYGDRVVMFDKPEVAKSVDAIDNFGRRTAIVFARNVSFDIARSLGLKYFMMLDDDFPEIQVRKQQGDVLLGRNLNDLDGTCEAMCQLMDDCPFLLTVALAQGGDFIGGAGNPRWRHGYARKAMNSFVCCVDRPLEFKGFMNEDVCMYTMYGQRGGLTLTSCKMNVVQAPTQSLGGGMSGEYRDSGTYVKTFYTVITSPACCEVGILASKNVRVHHNVIGEQAFVKVVREDVRKID